MRRAIESVFLLACLAAICIFLYLRLMPVNPEGSRQPVSSSTWRVGSVPNAFRGDSVVVDEAGTQTGDVLPEQTPAAPAVATAPDAIHGEYVFSFYDDADMEAFLKRVRDAGGTVVDRLDLAHSVRIRVKDTAMLERLTRSGPVPVEWSANTRVHTPPPAEPPLTGPESYLAFGAEALSWLGVPNRHDTWGKGITVAVLDTGIMPHPTLPEGSVSSIDCLPAGDDASGG